MQKKILYLRTDLCDKPLIAGGSVAHTIGVIEGFISLGYSVFCASSLMQDTLKKLPLKGFCTLANPRFVHFLRWKINCLLSSFFFTLETIHFIRKEHLDFVYQRYSLLNCTGILISRLKNIPCILEYNGSEVWVDKNWTKKHWLSLRFLIKFLEHINLNYAHLIVVVSKPLKDELIARGYNTSKILVNPNGVNTQFYNPDMLKNERLIIREKFGITNSFVFGFVGTFSAWHGIEMMAAIIPEILAKKKNVHFLLIGDGPLLNYFHTTVQKFIKSGHVTCTGIIPQHQSREYLAACDAFLCPTQPNPDGSPFFGSPTKIFEYMSMGKPIIASNLEQVGELISPAFTQENLHKNFIKISDQIGFAIPATDKNAFIKAACLLIDFHEQDRFIMGNYARKKATKNYDWQHHVNKIILKNNENKKVVIC